MAVHNVSGVPKCFAGGGTVTLYDGSGSSLVLTFEQSMLTFTESQREYSEARSRGRRQSTPVLVESADVDVTGSFDFLVQSWSGATAATPRDFILFTGPASSNTSRSDGNAQTIKIVAVFNTPEPGGASQSVELDHLRVTDLAYDEQENFVRCAANFVAHINAATIS